MRSTSHAPPLMSVVRLTTRVSVNIQDAGQHELGLVLEVDRRDRTLTCDVFGFGTLLSSLVWYSGPVLQYS